MIKIDFKEQLNYYKNNYEKINLYFYIIFIVLNIWDVVFTWYGVGWLGFTELNPDFKDLIHQGKFFAPISTKVWYLFLIGVATMWNKGKQHIIYSFLLFNVLLSGVLIYSFVNFLWAIAFISAIWKL